MRVKRSVKAAILAVFAVVLFSGARLDPAGAAATPEERAASFGWMTGDWEMTANGMHIEEHWTRAEGGTLIGMGRAVRGGKTVEFEYLRIEERPDGVYYVAHPLARPGTDFKLARFDGAEAVFENPQHDFPTRVIYRKNADGSLFARIEGTRRGQPASEDFPYQRMK
jgi:hypothetical protein